MSYDVLHGHSAEVVDLATGKNRWKQFVLLGSGKDEDGVFWWFFECFQKCIEGSGGEHVNLIDDEHFVFSHLRRNVDLFNQLANVVNTVVGGCVEFMNVVGTLLVEGTA